MKPKLLILSSSGDSLKVAYNYLNEHFAIQKVIIEDSVSKMQMLKYRAKKLGWFKVTGQLLFIAFSKFLSKTSQNRKEEILETNNITISDIPEALIKRVPSVNSKLCRKELKKHNSDFILVNGTRIIGKKTLSSTSLKFINIHAGITPKYRGVHGGYWALALRDQENCGATLHYIDAGVDTGEIIGQALIEPTAKDNFITYPLLQQLKGLELLVEKKHSILQSEAGFERNDLPSIQWFHPTLFEYIRNYIKYGLK